MPRQKIQLRKPRTETTMVMMSVGELKVLFFVAPVVATLVVLIR